jgi:hypothetical protein
MAAKKTTRPNINLRIDSDIYARYMQAPPAVRSAIIAELRDVAADMIANVFAATSPKRGGKPLGVIEQTMEAARISQEWHSKRGGDNAEKVPSDLPPPTTSAPIPTPQQEPPTPAPVIQTVQPESPKTTGAGNGNSDEEQSFVDSF